MCPGRPLVPDTPFTRELWRRLAARKEENGILTTNDVDEIADQLRTEMEYSDD